MLRNSSFILFNIDRDQFAFKGIGLFFTVYFGAILFASISSPWVYGSILWVHDAIRGIDQGNIPFFEDQTRDLFSYLSQKSFADYFDRLRWVPVVLLLPWLIRKCGLMSWQRLGVTWDKAGAKFYITGFIIGIALVTLLIIGQVASFPLIERKEITFLRVVEVILLSMMGGFILGLLEEIIFRGLVFRIFYTAFVPVISIILAALVFSYCHFKFPEVLWNEESRVGLGSGFYIGFWTVFGVFYNMDWVVFLNLFLLGVLLTLFLLKKKTLMYSVGFHAGIVFCMLTYKRLWILQDEGNSFFWGSPKMTDGLACSLLLCGLIAFYLRKGLKRE